MKYIILILLIYTIQNTFCSEDHHQDNHKEKNHSELNSKIGKNKAIQKRDEHKGFQLSKEAIHTLAIKFKKVTSPHIHINNQALVRIKNTQNIYIYRIGFFKLLPITIYKKLKNEYIISYKGFKKNDQIVIKGSDLLRVADIYASSNSQHSHSH